MLQEGLPHDANCSTVVGTREREGGALVQVLCGADLVGVVLCTVFALEGAKVTDLFNVIL